MIKKKSNKKR